MLYSIKKDILDIPFPIKLGGYGNRTDDAISIHDDLEVGVLLLVMNNLKLAIITLDILGIYNGYFGIIKNRIVNNLNIDDLEIIITCSHSHAAPQIGRTEKYANQNSLVDEIIFKSSKLIKECFSNLNKAKLSFINTTIDFLGGNRNNNGKSTVYLKTISLKNDNYCDLIINVNCHPTVLSSKNLEVSSEYPGALKRKVDNTICHNSLFFQGSCGDISTRFYRKSSSFSEIERFSNMLYDKLNSFANNYEEICDLSYHEYFVTLKAKNYDNPNEYEEKIMKAIFDLKNAQKEEKRIYETILIGIQKEYSNSKINQQTEFKTFYRILKVNNNYIIFHPFELFSNIEEYICKTNSDKNIILVGYCFDCMGYLLDNNSYDYPSYEKYSTLFSEEAGKIFAESINESLSSLKR